MNIKKRFNLLTQEDEVELLFKTFAEASLKERIAHCVMYLFKPNYMLKKYNKIFKK